jgi:hypothetical protein
MRTAAFAPSSARPRYALFTHNGLPHLAIQVVGVRFGFGNHGISHVYIDLPTC